MNTPILLRLTSQTSLEEWAERKPNYMHNFFDIALFQHIASGLLVLFVSILLGSRKTKGATSGKGWKITAIFAWVMILGGLYVMGINAQNGGFQNPLTGLGLSLFILGVCLKYVSKFFIWWHR